ncbi:MAG: type I DNA topoisomerase [Defluviitaleaceae bacterium]|nr:type I DNA topoisomerase [Defluviitaleaceae bacterium]MCL2836073.1 type I DNA topoisomerase [Defluviitaleaceae bacterium]
MAEKTAKKTSKPKKRNLVIVESPAKAKTLKKFLGDSYKIEASMGHVRDLPKSQLGVDADNDFEPKYITIRGKGDILKKLRKEAGDAATVYLATDPDREGEAISWHLLHSLNLDGKTYKRITFNEITKAAVKKSISEARDIDMKLVDSQQARRALDRIVGYKLSPLLWRKVRRRLSAGRVQSVTLRLICDREREIDAFEPVEYWTVDAQLLTKGKKAFSAHYGGELKTREEAEKITEDIKKSKAKVQEIKRGTRVRKPPAPFTTSTLQQEASKALNFAVSKTMLVAQQIYEGVDLKGLGTVGLVSYIRTDSARISDDAFAVAKTYITDNFGTDYAAQTKPEHKTRERIQDAHEAIRPTDITLTPDKLKDSLTRDQLRLYGLIWERFAASCMTAAAYDTVSIKISCGGHTLKSSGQIMTFEGYKKVYKKETDKDESALMPDMAEKDELKLETVTPLQHFTQPPPRFTEATLVRTLEENGVGRPSTYSPTITTLISRGYVTKEKNVLYPAELGEIVNDIMETHFGDVVDIEFTSKLEDGLDKIEFGEMYWKDLLREFYFPFNEKIAVAEQNIGEVDVKDEETDVVCEHCKRNMVIKYGRFGKFLACPGFPECKNALPYFPEAGVDCPLCDGKILIKNTKKGRKYFGCDNHPDCEFMSWQKPAGMNCPRCGEFLVEKNTKTQKRVMCLSGGCGYSDAVEDDESQD